MLRLFTAFQSRFIRDEEGATAVEYGLLVALIAAVIIGIVVVLGGQLNTAFTNVSGSLTGAGVSP